MSVKVIDLTPQVIAKTRQNAAIFLRLSLDTMHDAARPKTPKDKGNLRDNVLKTVIGLRGRIEWRKVYAAVQEVGYIKGSKIRNYTTPGTGPHFAENAALEVIKKTPENIRKAAQI